MIKAQDLLKDRPETGEEEYTENVEKTCSCTCGKKKGILLMNKEGDRGQ